MNKKNHQNFPFFFPVCLHLLSFLDPSSLRTSLLVNKKWYSLGINEKLIHISNRKNLEVFRNLSKLNNLEKMYYVLTTPPNLTQIYIKKLGRIGLINNLNSLVRNKHVKKNN